MIRTHRLCLIASLTLGCQGSGEGTQSPESASPEVTEGHPASAPGSALAIVGDQIITTRDFEAQVNEQPPYLRPRYQSVAKRMELLDAMIRFELLASEARRRGLHKHPDVVRASKQVMVQRLVKEEFEDKLNPNTITDEEMRAFYEANAKEFNRPEKVRVSAIILDDEGDAHRISEQAKGAAGATNKNFRELVMQHSKDGDTRQRGGDLGYLASDTTSAPPEVIRAALATTRTGEVVGPIQAGNRYFVLKQTGRKRAVSQPFEEVKRSIQNRVYREKRGKAQKRFVEGLRAKAKIEIDEANLATIEVGARAAPSPVQVDEDSENFHPHPH